MGNILRIVQMQLFVLQVRNRSINQLQSLLITPAQDLRKQQSSVSLSTVQSSNQVGTANLLVTGILRPWPDWCFEDGGFDIAEAGFLEVLTKLWCEVEAWSGFGSGFGDFVGVFLDGGALVGAVVAVGSGNVDFVELDVASWDKEPERNG